MLYDGLISLDLPSEPGPPLPTRFWEGLERLLFVGSWRRRAATCTLASGTALARCYAALRELSACDLALTGDADEGLDLQIPAERYGEAPPPWPELIPAAWASEPCDFRLRASLERPQLQAVVHLRYSPRHLPEGGALVGALRVLWGVAPRDAEDPEQFARDLAASLERWPLQGLHRALTGWGEHLSAALLDALRAQFPGARGAAGGQVVVPWGYADRPERFSELLAGFSDGPRAMLARIEAAAAGDRATWAAIDDRGVPGRIRNGAFVPVAEHLSGAMVEDLPVAELADENEHPTDEGAEVIDAL